MNAKTDVKRAVLRGVYEDNRGIPRSSHGKRRPEIHPAPQSPPQVSAKRGKIVLILVLGLATLIGFNFRIVSLRSVEPVAMQITEEQSLQSSAARTPIQTSPGSGAVADTDFPGESEFSRIMESAIGTTSQYDGLFSQLDIPIADLFDLKVQTIVIDPGHGGTDPGATGRQGLTEKDVALDIAMRLRDKLTQAGNYRVLLTRDEDNQVPLKERVSFAQEHHADLFISIHINAVPAEAGPKNYVETYYFGPHADQRSLALAEKENRDSHYGMGDFREIIARIGDTLKTEESRQLATSIQKHLYSNLKRHSSGLLDAGAKAGPFVVLLGTEVPSVLVEVSCISNEAEETRLGTAEYRNNVAGFLRTGIDDYLKQRTYARKTEVEKIQDVARQEK